MAPLRCMSRPVVCRRGRPGHGTAGGPAGNLSHRLQGLALSDQVGAGPDLQRQSIAARPALGQQQQQQQSRPQQGLSPVSNSAQQQHWQAQQGLLQPAGLQALAASHSLVAAEGPPTPEPPNAASSKSQQSRSQAKRLRKKRREQG